MKNVKKYCFTYCYPGKKCAQLQGPLTDIIFTFSGIFPQIVIIIIIIVRLVEILHRLNITMGMSNMTKKANINGMAQ